MKTRARKWVSVLLAVAMLATMLSVAGVLVGAEVPEEYSAVYTFDFESGSATESQLSPMYNGSVSAEAAREGSQGLNLASWGQFALKGDFSPNSTYVVTGYVKVAQEMTLRVVGKQGPAAGESETTVASADDLIVSTLNEWVPFEVTLTMPANTANVYLFIKNQGSTSPMYVDDVVVYGPSSKTQLETLVQTVADYNPANFTTASWTPVELALEAANTALENPDASEQDYADALAALSGAVAGLVWQNAAGVYNDFENFINGAGTVTVENTYGHTVALSTDNPHTGTYSVRMQEGNAWAVNPDGYYNYAVLLPGDASASINAAAYDTLVFWVYNGGSAARVPQALIEDASGTKINLTADGYLTTEAAAGQWTEIRVDLSDAVGAGLNLSQISKISLGFNGEASGVVDYFDDITFASSAAEVTREDLEALLDEAELIENLGQPGFAALAEAIENARNVLEGTPTDEEIQTEYQNVRTALASLGAVPTVKYEAEDATPFGENVQPAHDNECTSETGADLNSMGNLNSSFTPSTIPANWDTLRHVRFDVSVDVAGTYTLTLAYKGNAEAASDFQFLLQVGTGTTPSDTAETRLIQMAKPSGWVLSTVSVPVVLEAGSNTIFISGTICGADSASAWANYDYITLQCQSTSTEPVELDSISQLYNAYRAYPLKGLATDAAAVLDSFYKTDAESAQAAAAAQLPALQGNPLDFGVTMDGASIRVTDPMGLRFKSTITIPEALKSAIEGGTATVSYGMLMLPTEMLGGGELTLDTADVLNIAAEKFYAQDADHVEFTGVLVSIPETAYAQQITARSYATVTVGEETVTVYCDATLERSVSDVAQAALEAGGYSDEITQALQEIVDKANA